MWTERWTNTIPVSSSSLAAGKLLVFRGLSWPIYTKGHCIVHLILNTLFEYIILKLDMCPIGYLCPYNMGFKLANIFLLLHSFFYLPPVSTI